MKKETSPFHIRKGKNKMIQQQAIFNLEEILSIQNILIYLLVINLFGFFIMWLDKRKAKKGSWRIPEKTLFMVTALGGGIGTIVGMYTFRHKTQKLNFVIRISFYYDIRDNWNRLVFSSEIKYYKA